ncbi:molecular chaperone DnaJ [Arsenicitalea aurantiaca]|uniref:Molecular chaperone DnaJ n=1 Tax=Arsenicitalea aurantiaca TaxID=1783274 RepID=A0A433X5Y4_9HYPH|nr:DnaJ domain-containing protein [Arsenicitalea aurantiaca]RUT29447.1 molecular chaperone DnaJ [Arsenicitalea aurantiaca]
MKLDSKLFDAIRIRPRREEKVHVAAPSCGWEGCDQPGTYRAPKANRAEGYHNFCLEHVRHYNHAYNFFSGMKADEVEEHINTRPGMGDPRTFGLGAGPRVQARPRDPSAKRMADPLHIFARYARAQARSPQSERVKPLLEHDRRALEILGFKGHAKSDEIKKAYKSLVKIHHPDANGGDKSSEDRLRAIIAAYHHLKSKGFVMR